MAGKYTRKIGRRKSCSCGKTSCRTCGKKMKKTRGRGKGRRGGGWSVSGATSALSGMSNKDVMGIVGVIQTMSKDQSHPEWKNAWREWKRGFAGLQQSIPMQDVVAMCESKGINMSDF